VGVWAIPLAEPPASTAELLPLLSAGERARAERFRLAEDRSRAIVGRAVLRLLLAGCTGRDPASFRFETGAHGRPSFAGLLDDLDFNVAHSGEWVLVGVSRGGRVGVDVERIRELTDMDALLERFFAPGEARAVRSLAPADRVTAFFDCWTRKESFVKATGEGIQMGLDRFEVEPRPGRPPRLLSIEGSAEAASRWSLWSAAPDAGHRAAVSTDAPGEIHAWFWRAGAEPAPWAP